jgi:hypothetical protein
MRKSSDESWGGLPVAGLVVSLGVWSVSVAFTLSRAGKGPAEPLFWLGLLMVVLPVAVRQALVNVSRRERLGLVILLVLGLYLVKVLHSPVAFTFPDELTHIRNVDEIRQNGRLFETNPVLPVTALYPGLQSVTSALVMLSGLPVYTAGILVVGAARLVLALALFLFFEQASRSPRVAGVAAVIYTANSNFVFWTAQYAYESLALPLALVVVYLVARREEGESPLQRPGLTVAALVALAAVVITHHMSSYALFAFLMVVSIFYRIFDPGSRFGPYGLALITLVLTLAWLAFAAALTVDYLTPVFGSALEALLRTTVGEESTRQLFQSTTGVSAPSWERWVGLGSVALILAGLPFGFYQIYRHYRTRVFALVLAATALLYFPLLGLRLIPSGWEISNRTSEFLYLGIALILALAATRSWVPQRASWAGAAAFAGYLGIVFAGGIIAGWTPQARLAQPYRIAASGYAIEPQGVTAARWARAVLGPDNAIAADASSAKLLVGYGEQTPYTGTKYGVQAMFFSSRIGPGELEILQTTGVRYVFVDRRLESWDHMTGLYFNRVKESSDPGRLYFEPEVYQKFDRLSGVSRLFDSGDIVVYDVGRLGDVPADH